MKDHEWKRPATPRSDNPIAFPDTRQYCRACGCPGVDVTFQDGTRRTVPVVNGALLPAASCIDVLVFRLNEENREILVRGIMES